MSGRRLSECLALLPADMRLVDRLTNREWLPTAADLLREISAGKREDGVGYRISAKGGRKVTVIADESGRLAYVEAWHLRPEG